MRRPVSSGMLHVSDIKAILHFIDFEVLEEEIKDFQTVVDELEGNGVALAETEKDVLEAVNQRDKGLKAKKEGKNTHFAFTHYAFDCTALGVGGIHIF